MIVHAAVLVSAFLIFWFLALFCILPIGLGGSVHPESGAPARAAIVQKMLVATGIAAALWIAFYVAILLHLVDL